MSFEEFYGRIATGAMPLTSQVNVEQFLSFFEPYLKMAKDILHIFFSTGLSGTYNSACIAREKLLQRGHRIKCAYGTWDCHAFLFR